MTKKCCMCGGTSKDGELHRYGTQGAYEKNSGRPVYACNFCDPLPEKPKDKKAVQR